MVLELRMLAWRQKTRISVAFTWLLLRHYLEQVTYKARVLSREEAREEGTEGLKEAPGQPSLGDMCECVRDLPVFVTISLGMTWLSHPRVLGVPATLWKGCPALVDTCPGRAGQKQHRDGIPQRWGHF